MVIGRGEVSTIRRIGQLSVTDVLGCPVCLPSRIYTLEDSAPFSDMLHSHYVITTHSYKLAANFDWKGDTFRP